ncbi:MAG: hypothetical protein GXP08_05435 [Gammaproteobacteria bacterium]|nr:hypothetical protein [Gammaproteobacteria bacterium]
MLTFTQAQLNTFQASWQVEQLQAQLPNVMPQLAKKHPSFYATNKDAQHYYYGRQLIEKAVLYGYTNITYIQQLLDLEYGARKRLYAQTVIQPLYQARWLTPQDRINNIQYQIALKKPADHHRVSLYCLLDDYPRPMRCKDIALQALAAYSNDAQAQYLQLLRQALYHALLQAQLKDKRHTDSGWQAWQSDWQQALIGIEHPGYQRRIQLQPADNKTMRIEMDDSSDISLLKLHIPDQLSDAQHTRLNDALHAWALDLLQVEPMRALFASEKVINETDK